MCFFNSLVNCGCYVSANVKWTKNMENRLLLGSIRGSIDSDYVRYSTTDTMSVSSSSSNAFIIKISFN